MSRIPLAACLLLVACAQEEAVSGPGTVTGTIIHHASMASEHVDARNVDVWLPPDYDSTDTRYPVLYMHDGQNLFDPDKSYIGVDWGVDEAMTALFEETGKAAIVVGVWNTPKRFPEYMPRGMAEHWSAEQHDEVADYGPLEDNESDEYLRFLVEELKPWVDEQYRTRPARDQTMVMGSSMGGLISLYALTEYPDVFGAAGAISTHWPAAENGALTYLREALPEPGNNRIWFDFGTETLDARYAPWQARVDALMESRGWSEADWLTREFEGHDHSERAWQRRMPVVLAWLLGPEITSSVDAERLIAHQAALSAEDMQGRQFGTDGAEQARRYLAERLPGSSEHAFSHAGRDGVNLLLTVPGSEPGRGTIVITAHYDHMGVQSGDVYNGADDNASGTAALVEFARVIRAQPLRHDVVFAALDGEESGLRGARALVADAPFDLEEVVLNVNMDMISRSDEGLLWAAGTHRWPGLRDIIEPEVSGLPVSLAFGHDGADSSQQDWTSSSDHAPFHEAGIPFVYFGVEDHDGYHQPSDDLEDTTPAFFLEAVESIHQLLRVLDRELQGRVPPR
ncbi:MAG: M28 family peptidase [Rhodothermales bacterium]|nr:M28 family peptidase [Rhodothermales bacterium]MBO6780874.1 M28 family peptidase [Rhodothermales bacterium]